MDRVWPHPNADRLDLASVQGMSWQFVVGKGEYEPGTLVVYFPIDSVLPDPLIDALGIRTFLAGTARNRVKTVRLRGEISQGLVVTLPKICAYLGDPDLAPEPDTDLRERIGVEKYEVQPILSDAEALVRMPQHVSVFDVEGVDNYPHVAALLMDLPVVITEKLEGTNWWCSSSPDGEVIVGQRSHAIEEREGAQENAYWQCARRQGLIELCSGYAREHGCFFTLRGEMVGPKVQGNYYESRAHRVFLFAAQMDRRYLPSLDLFDLLPDREFAVPCLSQAVTLREWLEGRSIRDASDGKSLLNPRRNREGIVIVPVREQRHPEIGRLMLKQRSPRYLAKTDF